MAKFPPVYSELESRLLIAKYEYPYLDATQGIAMHLNPNISPSAPEFVEAWKAAMKAIEGLIEKGLVDAEQVGSGANMSFVGLKLKYQGKQEAIRERNRVAKIKEQLTSDIANANAATEELTQAQEKDEGK